MSVNLTFAGLVDALVAFLAERLGDIRQEPAPPPDGVTRPPRAPVMVAGWTPPKRSADEPLPPVIVVRASRGTDTQDGGTVTVRFLFLTYSEDPDGWRDVATLVQRTLNALTERMTLGASELQWPIEWTIPDEQVQPEWAAEITTTWSMMSTFRTSIETY